MAGPARFRCPGCRDAVAVPAPGAPTTCPTCGTRFESRDGIVELSRPSEDRDYPSSLIDLVAGVETRHFWFGARNDVIVATLAGVMGPAAGRRLLEIGCGTGFVLAALEAAGFDAAGIDMHPAALAIARGRVRGPLFSSDALALPFFADFDVAALFDVIEHAADDVAVLREAAQVLLPGGLVVVTVPAGPDLWTPYDEAVGHKRRYDRGTLRRALARAGLEPLVVRDFNCVARAALRLHRRRLSKRRPASHGDSPGLVRDALRVPPRPLNALLRLAVRLETPLGRLGRLRGGSIIAVAHRTGAS